MAGKKKMWILLGLILVLVVANWSAGAWTEHSEKKKAEEAEANKIYLSDAENVTAYSYTNGEQTMSFTKTDDIWTYDADTEIRMDQDVVQSMADSIRQMTAVRELEDPDPLEDYGLDTPTYEILCQDGDGEETKICIGNGAGENYYATVGDSGKVYTVSAGFQDYLQFDLTSLVQYDTVPSIGTGNLKEVTVTENGTDTVYQDEDQLGELAGGFGAMTLTDCADYHAASDALAQYGLDEANRITVTAVYTDSAEEEQTFCLYVGSLETGGTSRYVMPKGSNMVYRVSNAIVQNLMTIEEMEE